MDFIDNLGYLALGSRLKRLSDTILSQGQAIYQNSQIDFDPKWFPVFRLLYEKDIPLGIMEIASELNISHPYVIQLVRGLEKNKLIANKANIKDRRKRSIGLTNHGRRTGDAMTTLWRDTETALTSAAQETNYDFINALRLMESAIEQKSVYDRFKTAKAGRLMKQVEIIDYKEEYAPRFLELNLEWLEKYFYVEDIDREVLGKPNDHIIKKGGFIVFAKYHDEIVGTCALKKNEKGVFELTKMAVTEKAQGLQIGKKLAIAIIDKAKEQNLPFIYLETNSQLHAAIGLYKNLGFIEKKYPSNESEYERADVYMEMQLN